MKLFILTLVTALLGFNGATYEKTITDLKNAIRGESTASAKYTAFAAIADSEGHSSVAKLFRSAARAESIHASNHQKALEALGEKAEKVVPDFATAQTMSNLKAASEGEKYEVTTMYPQFIADATAEKADKARKSFSWASDTEKKHLEFYNNALAALQAKNESSLPAAYAVCPVCGNTFDNSKVDVRCPFCQTSKARFIIF